jgi:hypothetical protein
MREVDARVGQRVFRRRRITALVVLVALLAGTGLLIGRAIDGGKPAPSSEATPSAASHDPSTTIGTGSTTTTTGPPPTTTTGPGALPQTSTLPTTSSPIFNSNMAALWDGVSTGAVQNALPGFFPESAYVQLKAIASAGGDFTNRLVPEYEADVSAAHRLLGAGAAMAKLVGVDVNPAYAHWVPTGTCYNDVGYFELPNSRVVYSINGQVSSFGIASMISWRGEWYIVHLGAILRSGSGGEVHDPGPGPGTPIYSSTC